MTWIFGLVGFAFYYVKYYSSVEVLNRRFKYARSQTIIQEDSYTVFSNFTGTNPRDWNPLITNMQILSETDEHNDIVSVEVKPQQDQIWAHRIASRKFKCQRYWMRSESDTYTIILRSDDSPIGEMVDIITIEPFNDTRCRVVWISGLEMGGLVPYYIQERILISWVSALAGAAEHLLEVDFLQKPSYDTRISQRKGWTGVPAELNLQNSTYSFYTDNKRVPLADRLVPGYVRKDTGGILCNNQEDLDSQKGIIIDLIRKAGKQLMQGKNVVGVSLSAKIFEPRSTLERMIDSWCTAPLYLTQAAKSKDPIQRMKYTICFLVSGLHYGIRQLKPFNPILGETYQGAFEDGTEIFIEHTSHHPPIAHFLVTGIDGLYTYKGYYEFTAALRGDSVRGRQKGPNIVTFTDGGRIEFNRPVVCVSGLLYGERVVEWTDTMEFIDNENQLYCQLKFAERSFWRSSNDLPSDFFSGELVHGGTRISEVRGNYLENLQFDTDTYWELEKSPVFKSVPDSEPLPSDCRFREDMRTLASGDFDKANVDKGKLEVLQRHDRALRNRHVK